jgi:pectate lyase
MKIRNLGLLTMTLVCLLVWLIWIPSYAKPGPASPAQAEAGKAQHPYRAPNLPNNPSPVDNATGVSLNPVLSWQGGSTDSAPVTYTVAFSISNPPSVVTQVAISTYSPGTLLTDTTYYWQITASDGASDVTGPVWQFTTTADSLASYQLYLPLIVAGGGGSPPPPAEVVAFPGAEGFGAKATGGRGGQVLKVTSLSADGNTQGSLQWALDQPGSRIIVFEVSGLIQGDVLIPHSDVTIAGQTAPGAGITILGHLYTPYGQDINNIIIRHIRVRPPDPDADWPPAQHDAIQFSTAHTIILDHVDASHGADETIDFWGGAYDITVQWSAITYPIYDEANGWTHPKGILNHRACIDDDSCDAGDPLGGRISIHHNLFAHARNRTPALSTGPADVYNNLVYNGREGFVHHNIVGAADTDPTAVGEFNIVGNYYREGPSISLAPLWFDPENSSGPIPTSYWVWNNYVDDPGDFEERVDNPFTTPGFEAQYTFYCCGIEAGQFDNTEAFDFSAYAGYVAITAHEPATAYNLALDEAGAWPRDIVTLWAIEDTQNRGGAWANRRPADWLEGLTPGAPPTDSDDDGIPDTWESANGLNPNNGSDASTEMPSGYPAIEEYINEVADNLVGGN